MGLPVPSQPQGFGSYGAYASSPASFGLAPSQSGLWGSLWSSLKSIAKPVLQTGVELYSQYVKSGQASPPDITSIAYQIPNYGANQIPGPNYQLYTDYPRQDNSATPASVVVGGATGAGGVPSSYLLIGIGLLAFMMMRKR